MKFSPITTYNFRLEMCICQEKGENA